MNPVKMAEMGDAMNEARGTVNEKPIASLAEIKTMLYEIIEEDMKKRQQLRGI